MKKIVMPAKRVVPVPEASAEIVADKPRERRRLGLNYGRAGDGVSEEGQAS